MPLTKYGSELCPILCCLRLRLITRSVTDLLQIIQIQSIIRIIP